jgi:hypothetical protein
MSVPPFSRPSVKEPISFVDYRIAFAICRLNFNTASLKSATNRASSGSSPAGPAQCHCYLGKKYGRCIFAVSIFG